MGACKCSSNSSRGKYENSIAIYNAPSKLRFNAISSLSVSHNSHLISLETILQSLFKLGSGLDEVRWNKQEIKFSLECK